MMRYVYGLLALPAKCVIFVIFLGCVFKAMWDAIKQYSQRSAE